MLNELRRWLFDEYLWLRDVWRFRRFPWSNQRLANFTRVSRFSEEDRIDLDELDAYRARRARMLGVRMRFSENTTRQLQQAIKKLNTTIGIAHTAFLHFGRIAAKHKD